MLRFILVEKNEGRMMKRHMRFQRLPFGVSSSPFILNATLRHHFSWYMGNYNYSFVTKELSKNLYVDNFCTGSDTKQEAFEIHQKACHVLSQASMPLTKWISNDQELNDNFINFLPLKYYIYFVIFFDIQA